VFTGGWSLEAAQAVCAGGALDGLAVLDTLDRLVDQSLVQMDDVAGHGRYRLLETLRQFAQEQLESCGEADEVGRLHAIHFLRLAEDFGTPHGPVALAVAVRAQFELEHDNLRSALHRSVQRDEVEFAMRLADALERIWYVRGPYAETRRLLEDVLAMPGARAPTELRASLLIGAARARIWNADLSRAQPLAEEALAIARATHNLSLMAQALQPLATSAELQGEVVRARTLSKRALVLARRVVGHSGDAFRGTAIGDRPSEGYALTDLARILWKQGDLDQAVALAEEAYATTRALDAARPRILALIILGNALRDQGNLARSRAVLEEGVTLARQLNDERNLAFCLDALGQVAVAQGQRAEAQARLAESLRMWWVTGQRAKVLDSLESHARLAANRGQHERALRLTGAATALRETLRVTATPQVQAVRNQWIEEARVALGELSVTSLLSAGHRMTVDEGVAYALRESHQGQPSEAAEATMVSWSPLTPREREVARLVSRGLSNRQIASELIVTEATAAKHVENIREKLGLNSRMQIGVWVRNREVAAAPLTS
jgi:ATP/maltotriose-dependent transcriptional regulator MalT